MKYSTQSLLVAFLVAVSAMESVRAKCPCAAPAQQRAPESVDVSVQQQFQEVCRAIGLPLDTSLDSIKSDECMKMGVEIAKTFSIKMIEYQAKNTEDISEDMSTRLLMDSLSELSNSHDTEMLKKGFALFVMYPDMMMQHPMVVDCIEKTAALHPELTIAQPA